MFTAAMLATALLMSSPDQTETAQDDSSLTDRCMTLPPLCPRGERPVCICPNEHSMDCYYVCMGG